MRRPISSVLLTGLIAVLTTVPAWAQAQLGTGAIAGIVVDSSDAVVAGAHIIVTCTDTGLVREATTTRAGQFAVPVLPPGGYLVVVEQEGFAPIQQKDLVVSVGSTTTLRIGLKPKGVAETVDVNARPAVDSAKTDTSSLIDRTQINDLPINGRRADQFALLTPGVTRDGRFGLLSYRGQAGVFNNFTLEGNDDNQAYFSEARGRTRIASNISANAIREFSVSQAGFMPEFGRSAGGGINAVVRSGTNRRATDGFYYFRNQAFNAQDPLATIKPDETRQQFGGSTAGPIVHDRAFYFFNVDQQLRDFPLLIEDLNGVLTSGLPANPSAADVAAFNAGVADLRSRFPDGGPGHTMPRTNDQTLILGKVDVSLSRSHMLSITNNYLRAHGIAAIQTPLVLGNVGRNGSDDVRIESFNVRLTSTLSSRSVNEMRFQAGRDFEFEFADQPPPQVFVGSSFSFGRATFLERPALPDERKLQFVDNWSLVAGHHSFKTGIDIVHAKDIIDNPAQFGGVYNYSNALTYGRDLLDPNGKNYSSFQQNFGLVGASFSTLDVAAFVQDAWRPVARLTINYGIRYDFQQNPDPIAPNPAIPETQSINSYNGNFGPRLGVAYDLTGNGRTIARMAWGVYYGRTPNGLIQNALAQTGLFDPAVNTVSLTVRPADSFAVTYPNILPSLPAGASGSATAFRLDPDFKSPRMRDFNIGVERQLTSAMSVTASFIYTHGDRLTSSFDTNLPAPAFTRTYVFPDGTTVTLPFSAGMTRAADGTAVNINLSRPNPNFGALTVVRSIGETWYRAMFLELKKRLGRGYQFGIAYTLAHAENTGGAADGGGTASESPFGGASVQNQFDLKSDRGTAPTDQRHRLVINGIANLRYGFRVSGIVTAESGRPYSDGVSVPSLPFTLDGAQYNGFGGLYGQGGGGDRNVAPNTVRNSTYGDANYRVDLRIARDFKVRSGQLELLVEGFNIFNRRNFNGFRSTRYDATATTVTTPLSQPIALTERTDFGTPNNDGSQPDGTNARRFQIAARVRF
jgi:Carboxypeptidase regulatory-like domain